MRPKLVLFGDSITEESFGVGGWGAALTDCFSRTADVVLRAYSGYNTRWALKVVERVFEGIGVLGGHGGGADPVAVTVFFGANDATLPDRASAFQHVPVPEYKANLLAIISFIKLGGMAACSHYSFLLDKANYMIRVGEEENTVTTGKGGDNIEKWPKAVVVLITPPPIDEDGRIKNPFGDNASGLPERTNESAGAYAGACVAVAADSGVPVVDLWSGMQQIPGWEKALLSDGLHLTPEGNKVVFEELVAKLKDHGVTVEALPTDLPLLADIDPNDPIKAFTI